MKAIIQKAIGDYCEAYPCWNPKDVTVVLRSRARGNVLGMYKHDSYDKPIVYLYTNVIKKSRREGYSLSLIITTTIYHELTHAVYDCAVNYFWDAHYEEKYRDEDFVEIIAHDLWDGVEHKPTQKLIRKMLALDKKDKS